MFLEQGLNYSSTSNFIIIILDGVTEAGRGCGLSEFTQQAVGSFQARASAAVFGNKILEPNSSFFTYLGKFVNLCVSQFPCLEEGDAVLEGHLVFGVCSGNH